MPLHLIAPTDLLAVAQKHDANVSVTGTTTPQAVDDDLLRLAFVAPGPLVLVTLSATATASTAMSHVWALLDDDDNAEIMWVPAAVNSALTAPTLCVRHLVTVTPGEPISWRWAIAPDNAARTTTLSMHPAFFPPGVMTAHRCDRTPPT